MRNQRESLAFGRAARNVLIPAVMAVSTVSGALGLAVLPAACVVPVPLELDQPDAAPNSPPIITSVKDSSGNEVLSPGPLKLSPDNETEHFFFTLSDNDRDDNLTVYLYADYNRQDSTSMPRPTTPLQNCIAPPGEVRNTDCSLANICAALALGPGNPHFFEAMVTDRPIDLNGTPVFRAVPAPGLSTSRAWILNCETE
jgi:hypothetical protein